MQSLSSRPESSGPTSSRGAALLVLGVLLACTGVALTSAALALPAGWTHGTPDFPDALLARAWVHWDAGWYAKIVQEGYWYIPGQQSPVAFFPAYPLVVTAVTELGLNRFWAGILVTLVCGASGLWLFHRWAQRLAPPRDALRALALLALYPFAFYLYGVMYSDALFLLLGVGAFLCLERGQLWAAVALGALATAARPVAPAVVLGLLVRQWELRRARGEPVRLTDAAPLLAGAGLGLWMLYLWVRFDDPVAFATVQSAPGWGQGAGWDAWTKAFLRDQLLHRFKWTLLLRTLAHAGVAFGLLALVPATWRRLGKGYAVYLAVCIGIPTLSTKDFMGLGRYALAAFPAFLTLALLLRERPHLRRGWLALSAVGLAVATAAFAADQYVS